MQYFAYLNSFYKSIGVQILKLMSVVVLAYLSLILSYQGVIPKVPLFLLSVLFMNGIFFHFKIGRVAPKIPVASNAGSVFDSFTLLASESYMATTTPLMIKKLLYSNAVQFMLHKADLTRAEVVLLDINKEQLSKYALEVVKNVEGTYVTTTDLFAAYLLLTEPQTKLLFNKKVKPEEFMHIVQWTRSLYPLEENQKPTRVSFWGEGIGEALTFGWTLETRKYTRDYTLQAIARKPLTTGREVEFKELVDALSKKENNNVFLVGDSGVGKDALVEALAYKSYIGGLNNEVNNKHIYELLTGPLLAGATDRNQLETRLQEIITEISHAGNVILFVPQFQNLITSSSFGINLAGILMPNLSNGKLPLIATIDFSSYKQYVEYNPLRDVFEVIKLEPPDKNTAVRMLFEKTEEVEKKNNVFIAYRAIIAAVEYANRYIPEKLLPGNAVTLLEDTVNSVSLSHEEVFDKTKKKIVLEDHVIAKIEEKTKIAVAAPNEQEKDFLLHVEDKIHERIINQVEAVQVIGQALRRLRSGLTQGNKPISFLFLGPTGVGKTETAKALADIYFKNANSLIRLDMSEYTTQDGVKRLLGAVPGEGQERGELTEKVYEHPYSLILLDEFEKANHQILDLFLQVLDDGRLTDNKGKTVSFVNNIIIATSNAASEFIRQELAKGTKIDKTFQDKLLNLLQSQGTFKPELLNRFDAIVVFKPLGEPEVLEITRLLLKKVSKRLLEQDIEAIFDEKVTQKIARESFTQEFGARPIKRYIQDNVEELLSQKILKNEIQRGSTIHISVDNENSIQAT